MESPRRIWIRAGIPAAEFTRIEQTFPSAQFLKDQEAETQLELVDAVFTEDPLPEPTVQRMINLQWLHASRGGAFPFLTPTVKAHPITVTCSKGIHGPVFSEFALACILALAKRLPQCWDNQRNHRWRKLETEEVSGKTLGIIGLGTVGAELARKAKALGMRVIAIKRRPETKPEQVDELGPPGDLLKLLRQSDFVVVALASIPSTENMLGERELRAMKKSAFLINLTGGKTITEGPLIRALQEGWLAGAALDAFPRQPLAADSPLWNLPNVIISPRIAGFSARKWEDVLPIFEENLRLFMLGKDLRNVIDKELGY